ncbi:MAG: hypothetical protein K0S41_93 [Anaerocolumna sp.]|jgi:hypothetical protein|nr:hypothetical protein [Anaerocolumna sp.]
MAKNKDNKGASAKNKSQNKTTNLVDANTSNSTSTSNKANTSTGKK